MLIRNFRIAILLAMLLAIFAGSVSALNYTPTMVTDIQTGAPNGSPEQMIVFDGKLVFRANDGTNGVELWTYDGINPPAMLANINPSGDSNPDDFAIYNSRLYFRANDGANGYELWEYDGTNPPSMVLPELVSGSNGSYPEGMTVYNGSLYFSAYLWPHGTELFQFNGAGITLAANINTTDPDGNSSPYSLEVYDGQLYFNADDGATGDELWTFDGTTATQADDIVLGAPSSGPDYLTVYNGILYFTTETAAYGIELWQYDSSTGIASLAVDIYTGTPDGYPEDLTVYNGALYFSATADGGDYSLWAFDGSTATPITDAEAAFWLTEFNGKLYFAGYYWPEGYELLSYDGTDVAVAADINPGGNGSPRYLAAWGDKLFFQGDDGTNGDELWELSDITGPKVKSTSLKTFAITEKIKQIKVIFDESVYDPAGSSGPDDVTNPANYLLVSKGPDKALNTASCAAGVSGDDIQIAVNTVSYDDASFTATLEINNGVELPTGYYALFVCGTTSISDELGNLLNDGFDEIIEFRITDVLPATGFAPGVHTAVTGKNTLESYSDLWLEVPQLGIQMDILGVPASGNSWDVSWLGDNAGWLGGSAFPTYVGNTVITGHVWSANGYPGPFVNVKSLQHGNILKIHAWGMVYTYEVRENRLINPAGIGTTFRHEAYDWVTLMTCEDWQSDLGSYRFRRLVRAILVDVSPE